METKRAGNGSMMLGLLFILLGVVFLIATQGTFGFNWGTIWPAFLMLAGILNLAQVPRLQGTVRAGSVMGGTTLLLLGAFFFTTTLDWTTWEDQGRLWPIYLPMRRMRQSAMSSTRSLPAQLARLSTQFWARCTAGAVNLTKPKRIC